MRPREETNSSMIMVPLPSPGFPRYWGPLSADHPLHPPARCRALNVHSASGTHWEGGFSNFPSLSLPSRVEVTQGEWSPLAPQALSVRTGFSKFSSGWFAALAAGWGRILAVRESEPQPTRLKSASGDSQPGL